MVRERGQPVVGFQRVKDVSAVAWSSSVEAKGRAAHILAPQFGDPHRASMVVVAAEVVAALNSMRRCSAFMRGATVTFLRRSGELNSVKLSLNTNPTRKRVSHLRREGLTRLRVGFVLGFP